MGISGSLYAMGTDMATIGGTFGGTAPEAETLGEALSMMFSNGIFGIGNGVWLIVGLVASLAIMAFGVGNGIEKANKVMMPALFFLFVILGIYICTLPGASEGYKYIFTLKPEGLLNPQVWVFAFGQAFFSLSVAGNGSVIYGSYLPKDEDLPSSARNVALFDTIAALLAAIVIIPAMAVILGDGIVGMKGGPGLMFVYLVNVFNAMPGGRIVGMIFYICVLFAGVSSIVNLYEAPVAFLQEKLHTNRVLSVVIIGAEIREAILRDIDADGYTTVAFTLTCSEATLAERHRRRGDRTSVSYQWLRMPPCPGDRVLDTDGKTPAQLAAEIKRIADAAE